MSQGRENVHTKPRGASARCWTSSWKGSQRPSVISSASFQHQHQLKLITYLRGSIFMEGMFAGGFGACLCSLTGLAGRNLNDHLFFLGQAQGTGRTTSFVFQLISHVFQRFQWYKLVTHGQSHVHCTELILLTFKPGPTKSTDLMAKYRWSSSASVSSASVFVSFELYICRRTQSVSTSTKP